MSHYETCSICGDAFEPVNLCIKCDDALAELKALRTRVVKTEAALIRLVNQPAFCLSYDQIVRECDALGILPPKGES